MNKLDLSYFRNNYENSEKAFEKYKALDTRKYEYENTYIKIDKSEYIKVCRDLKKWQKYIQNGIKRCLLLVLGAEGLNESEKYKEIETWAKFFENYRKELAY